MQETITEQKISILLKTRAFHIDNWDFPNAILAFRHLGELDEYYFIEMLHWLAGASLLDEMNALIYEKGSEFFRNYQKSPRVDDFRAAAIRRILDWHEQVFLCVKYKRDTKSIEKHERIVLELIHNAEYMALKEYMNTNANVIFKECRDMVSVYAVSVLADNGLFTPELANATLNIETNNLRNKRLVQYYMRHAWLSGVFFGVNPFVALNIINLLRKSEACGGMYGKELIALLYKTVDTVTRFVGPTPDDAQQTMWNDWKNGYYDSIPIRYSSGISKKISNPRVAVCISGMTRGSNRALKSIKDNIIDPLEADTFLSTWDVWQTWPGWGGAGSMLAERIAGREGVSLLPKELDKKSAFQKHFPNTAAIIKLPQEQLLDVTFYTEYFPLTAYRIESEEEFLSSIPFDKRKLLFQDSYNQVKMFYQIFSAHQLVLEYEVNKGIQYDYIIRVRPDGECHKMVTKESLEPFAQNEISVSFSAWGPSDHLWIGKRDAMTKLSSLWKYMFSAQRFDIYENYHIRSHQFVLMALAKLGLTTSPSLTQMSLNAAAGVAPLEIREALAKDFAGTGAGYKDNEGLKSFFRLIAQDPSVC